MFLLDTNAVIAVISERVPVMARRLEAEVALGTPLLLSSVVLYELRYGIAKSARRERNEAILATFLELPLTLVPFDGDDARHAADIRASLEALGTPIGPYDVLIAAQARQRRAALVTLNRREFDRVPGLIVTDWAV